MDILMMDQIKYVEVYNNFNKINNVKHAIKLNVYHVQIAVLEF